MQTKFGYGTTLNQALHELRENGMQEIERILPFSSNRQKSVIISWNDGTKSNLSQNKSHRDMERGKHRETPINEDMNAQELVNSVEGEND